MSIAQTLVDTVCATPISGRGPLVSVIIPVVDEANSIGKTTAAVHRNDVPFEMLVVDAGSADRTAEIAELAGARIIRGARCQRAYQLINPKRTVTIPSI